MKKINIPRRKKFVPPVGYVKLGSINTSIFFFISPPIIFFFTFISGVIAWGHHAIYHFFTAGEVPLNTMICTGIFYSLGRILANLLIMHRTARYLRRVELVAEQDVITGDDVNKLRAELEKSGSLINTKNMADVLDTMSTYSQLQFTDGDARLIKSKLGQRTSHNRQSVGFLGGLLIMMGLLGTYLGLLETIDEVGKAMAGMANIGGSDAGAAPAGGEGGLSDDQMSNFIGSIAAPLQGMGLAFSASLFGIGGSLIVSFFNYLAGHTQNHFIENVSRWIDERIPSPHKKAKDAGGAKGIQGGDDLKAWLASFAYLSQKTHKKLGQLIVVMSQTVATLVNHKDASEVIVRRQTEIHSSLERLNLHVEDFKKQASIASSRSDLYLKNLDQSLNNVVEQGATLRDINQNISMNVSTLNQKVDLIKDDGKSVSATLVQNIKTIISHLEKQQVGSEELSASVEGLKNTLSHLGKVEQELVGSIGSLKESVPHQTGPEISNLVWQLNSLVEELHTKNDDYYSKFFTDATDKEVENG